MRASGYNRTENDYYVEPKWVVNALLDVEPFYGVCWDPACGSGTIPKAIADRGMLYHGSDIADRGYGTPDIDFFKSTQKVSNIISNPPYSVLQEWVDHSLKCTTQKVAVIARLAFLESMKRKSWFESRPIARVWVSSRRVSMPPGGADIPAKGGSIAFSWYVFEHGHKGPPTIGWV